MKKMAVTFTVQTEVDYDETEETSYEEDISHLISELEDMGFSVTVESEEVVGEDEDEEV